MEFKNFWNRKNKEGGANKKHYFFLASPNIREKGEVENNPSVWPFKELGEEHPFDAHLMEGLVKNYGVAGGIVDKYLNYIWGQGFYVECKEPGGEKAVKIINDFNKQVNMSVLGRKWVKDALIKPGGYLEIETTSVGGKKVVSGLKVLDGKYIYVQRDKKGKITGYNQYIGRKFNKASVNSNKPTPFSPDEIIALHYNAIGDMPYGLGILWQNATTLNDLAGLEKDMHTLLHRKANSPLHIKLGNVNSDGSIDMPTPEAIDSVRNDLEVLTNKTEWVTDRGWEIIPIDFGKIADKFDIPLKHDILRLVIGFKMPEVIMGSGNIAEGLAGEQGDDWEKTITTMQEETESVLESLYKRILKQNGLDLEVEVIWSQPTNKEKQEKITMIQGLIPVVGPSLRYELEKQLAQLVGVDPSVVDDPETLKKLEDESKLPGVPGDKNTRQNIQASSGTDVFSYHLVAHEKKDHLSVPLEENLFDPFSEDTTIKEWLGFDFTLFKKKIIDIIRKDDFSNLAAVDESEIEVGYLDANQVDSLRKVLNKAFSEGGTVKQLSQDILSEVRPGDLYKYENGVKETVLNELSRVYNIARTETVRIANIASKDTYEENGVESYRWLASTGQRTCNQCAGMNGKVFGIKDNVLPPIHSMCRCTVVPVTDLE